MVCFILSSLLSFKHFFISMYHFTVFPWKVFHKFFMWPDFFLLFQVPTWVCLIESFLLLLLLSRFSRVRLCNPIDSSPTGSPVPGILQARTLEWVAISFSNAWNWKVKVKSLSRVRLLATSWIAAYQAPPSMGFSRQEYWGGAPVPSPNSCKSNASILQCSAFFTV